MNIDVNPNRRAKTPIADATFGCFGERAVKRKHDRRRPPTGRHGLVVGQHHLKRCQLQ
jgi:hypothetical protein